MHSVTASVTYTEKGMRDAEASSFGISFGVRLVSKLRYADDTALIEGLKEAIEQLTTKVNKAGKQLNLKLNVKKTKLLVAERAEEKHHIKIDGESVEQVNADMEKIVKSQLEGEKSRCKHL